MVILFFLGVLIPAAGPWKWQGFVDAKGPAME